MRVFCTIPVSSCSYEILFDAIYEAVPMLGLSALLRMTDEWPHWTDTDVHSSGHRYSIYTFIIAFKV